MENERFTEPSTAAGSIKDGSPRKILGDLSTNAQMTPKVPSLFQKKSMTGTPLKRSFAASMKDDGFTYLKRRRLSYGSITPTTEEPELPRLPHEMSLSSCKIVQSADNIQHSITAVEEHPDDRESSTERHSFSSLINYDPSSQASQSRVHSKRSPSPAQLTRAEVLRLRLRIAMYKVRTKQTTISFDYLREDTASGSRESSKAVQEAVAQLRQEAHAKLGLTPVLDSSISLTPTLSSELPISPIRRFPYDIAIKTTPARLTATEPSSSAVKGQVAEGLLGLKHGFR